MYDNFFFSQITVETVFSQIWLESYIWKELVILEWLVRQSIYLHRK